MPNEELLRLLLIPVIIILIGGFMIFAIIEWFKYQQECGLIDEND